MPYLTDEERKEKLWRQHGRFIFQCAHQDLSAPVRVAPLQECYTCRDLPPEHLVAATASFVAWWTCAVHVHLNGFSGMDTITWQLK